MEMDDVVPSAADQIAKKKSRPRVQIVSHPDCLSRNPDASRLPRERRIGMAQEPAVMPALGEVL
jgi:hypothetical protein